MVITYQGLQSFRVQFGDTVLAFDPVSKESKHKTSSFGADIALSSINHPDMNGVEQASRGDKQAFAITGPGEYEVGGVFIRGIASESEYGGISKDSGSSGEKRINTIYTVNLEGMNICFLGALGSPLSPEAKQSIDSVDILIVAIGGDGVLDPASSYKLAVSLEPSIIIPMHYDDKALKAFLKEGGSDVKPEDKLTLKKKDLEGKQGEIVVLTPQ